MDGAEGVVDTMGYYALLNISPEASEEEVRRAYRERVQIMHPDKQPDDANRTVASEAFLKLQEAYEVLVDTEGKRVTYDVYGKQGLDAGLDVAVYEGGMSREQQRAEWAEFQRHSAQGGTEGAQRRPRDGPTAGIGDRIASRGIYVVKMDATSLLAPYDRGVTVLPEVVSTLSNPSTTWALSNGDQASFGIHSVMKRGVGGSSFVAGYHRALTPLDSLDASAMIGLQTMFALTSTRQFNETVNASVGLSYQPEAGVGLQIGSNTQLSKRWSGDGALMLGPQNAHGVGLTLTRTGETSKFVFKVDLGMAAGVSIRYAVALDAARKWTLRAHGKFGLQGIEAEAGVSRKLRGTSFAGYAVNVNIGGVSAKLSGSVRGQQVQVPVLLTHDIRDWRVIAGATIAGPLAVAAVHFTLVAPLMRRHRIREAMKRRKEGLVEIRRALDAALASQRLLHPVGFRRAAKAASQGGLVIVEAVYGCPGVLPQVCARLAAEGGEGGSASQPAANETGPPESDAPAGSEVGEDRREGGASRDDEDSGSDGEDSGSDDGSTLSGVYGRSKRAARAAEAQAEAALTAAGELPPQWLDVTDAVRFMVKLDAKPSPAAGPSGSSPGGRDGSGGETLRLHAGVHKSGLMGFCDVAPGAEKVLRIAYLLQGEPFLVSVGETQVAELPHSPQGLPLHGSDADHVIVRAKEQGLLPSSTPAASSPGGASQGSGSSPSADRQTGTHDSTSGG
mmetsp:Transcript_4852/g.13946  ORF Transcript_4852/g.13946 Transcript_4852/m.13946 type:complete len:731 (+) Transcript_4852:327-2519(+)|eukprot:CAMPEP_0206141248 /NCGR_PEP_ID=MMETSP1473-20131121/12241_1 /ASSEMBLY_ACC=CAM_ASM_001109 /TAXON_ID=1461547 /ORGANISM="Stichococcus sp, Strain RCC1054" /LENGTH=730 /DNA_ID=CAMNT_0053535731 /DNA_START=250 /DNA_END=2442 /DNA_ORIENTATION=+